MKLSKINQYAGIGHYRIFIIEFRQSGTSNCHVLKNNKDFFSVYLLIYVSPPNKQNDILLITKIHFKYLTMIVLSY